MVWRDDYIYFFEMFLLVYVFILSLWCQSPLLVQILACKPCWRR